jgi:IS1 family transposase/transposase-like protein
MEYQHKNCPHCSSHKVVKNGRNTSGAQKLKCKSCNSHFQAAYKQGVYQELDIKTLIINLLFEKISLRGIARALQVSDGFVSKTTREFWEESAQLSPIDPTLEEAQNADIQIDEFWTYVGSKHRKVWLMVARDRRSKRIIAWHFGGRSAADVRALWHKIHPLYRKHALFMTDDWRAFQSVLPSERHFVGKQWTHEIEGFFSALRQRCNRIARKTVGFSKKIKYHCMAIVSLLKYYQPSTAL